MLNGNLGYKTIHELVDTMNDMMLDPNDILTDCRKNSAIWEPEVHAFRECYLENINSLRELDMLPTGYLGGIPFAHKDNISVKGQGTYCCSKILDGYISPYDANVTERLIAAGGMIAGRANMDEFAMGSSTEYSAYGPTRNPWNLTKVPGGSSGGSAAAVASGQAIFATGSDTGGSVRLPASFCNLVGLRPTYGRVSRYGLVAFASSLDQIGPITRDVRDCAIVFSIIAGYDERDSTSIPEAMDDPLFTLDNGVGELRVGFLDDDLGDAVDPQIRAMMDEWKSFFESNAASLKPVKLGTLKYLLSSYYIIAPSEASSNLARYDGIRYGPTVESDDLIELFTKNREIGFGPEVKRRIMIGTFALSTGYYDAYYLKAQKLRTLIRQEMEDAFKEVDVIISPSSPVLPFNIGERVDDPLQMYATDVFQLPQALAGTPAVSIPGGFSKEGLPIGLQIWGKPLGESTILQAARAFEREHDFVKRVPVPPGGEA
jgi:aspartyl-tRNA(Asn)/glutamyl-tRNA(Gln) amidotransferase subunit A